MPLSEADAITIRDTFDTLPDGAKPLASDWLKRYKDQQDEFGLPLFPSDSAKAEEEQKAFFSMFDDLKSVDAGNGIYDQAERLKAGDGDRLRMREAGMRFLARQYAGVSPDIVRRDYPLYRDDFAIKAGGKRDMGDGEFYSFAKEQVAKQREAQDLRAKSLDTGFRAAIESAGSLEAFAKVAATAGDVDKSEVDPSSFLESYSVATETLNKHRGLVREIMDGVKANMDGGDVDLEPLKERLIDLPGTERRMVLASLRMQAEKASESASAAKGGKYWGSFWQQTGESAFRVAQNAMTSTNDMERAVDAVPETNSPESMFGGGGVQFSGKEIKTAEDARKYVQESIAYTLGTEATIRGAGPQGGVLGAMDTRNTIKLDAKAQRLIADAKEREKKRIRVDNEIRTIGEAADPIPNVFASTIGTSGAALLLMAGTRGLAAPALASAYSNIEYNDLSLKYPTMSREEKAMIAGLSCVVQSALDFVGVKFLDKLPGIKSLLAQPLTRQLAGRALARGAAGYAAENVGEAGQDLATPALMGVLKSGVPGFDWDAEKRDFWKGRADVAVGLLPLTLLGMGAASVNEYRGAKELLTWNDKLASAGVVEQDRTAIIETAQGGDVKKAQTMLIDAWGRRDPATAAEYQAAMAERQGQQQAAIADLERLGALPTIRRDGDGWTVRQGETVAKFKTWEEARDVATQSMNDAEAAQVELVASLADGFLSSTPSFLKGESVEFRPRSESLVDRVSAGALTPESAMEAAIAGGVIKGVSMTEARSIAADVFGGQSKDERAAQFRADVEKIAVLGRNVVTGGESRSVVNAAGNEKAFLTAVEEVVEGRWKGGLERRAFTREQGMRFVQMAETATGEKFLEGATWEELAASKEASPRALTEAISRVIVADVLGRMKDGKRIGPGSVSRGLNLNDREQSAFALILDTFRRLFKALLETAAKLAKARAEGKLGEEYDGLFDALTGGSSQIEHEAGAAKEAETIRDEAASDWVDDSEFDNSPPSSDTFSMASASGAAQTNEPSPGGLSIAQVIKKPLLTPDEAAGISKDQWREMSDEEKRALDVDTARNLFTAAVFQLPDDPKYSRLEFDGRDKRSRQSDSLYVSAKLYLTEQETNRLYKRDEDGQLEYDWELDEQGYQIDDDDKVFTWVEVRISDHPSTSSAKSDPDIDLMVSDGRASRESWYRNHPQAFRSFSAAMQSLPDEIVKHYKLVVKQQTPTVSSEGSSPVGPRIAAVADQIAPNNTASPVKNNSSFNPSHASDGTSFSIGAGDFASRMENRFALFEAKPELRLAVANVAKQRALRLGAEWIEKAAVLRTAASIEKEQAFREADGTEQRIQAYLDSLTPSARQELEFEPSALENDPLIAAMLDEGKLMSRSTAVKNGVKNLDEYDGAPWLPPAWYSKGSGITPGKMAKALHDGPTDQGGPLAGNSAQDLWEALASRIASTRKNKEAHRQAVQAYQEAKRAAKADAKAEAEAWASQTKKQAGSAKAQRDALKAALRTLDGILAAAPAVVRARVGGYVKLAGLATDEAMLSEIERRIDKLNRELEKWLKKETVGEIRALLKKGRPDAEAGKKAKGKDADLHYLFAAAEKAAKLDALGVTAELASLDARIMSGELTPEQEVLAMTERGIVELVGDLDNADADKAYAALEALRDVYEGAWLKWKLAEIERKERRAGMRQEFIDATGKEGLGKQRSEADKEARKWFGIKAKWLSLSSFGEVLNYAFGSGSLTNSLVDSERKASNSYEDANQKLADEVEELFTSIAGGRLAGEKLRWEMAQESIVTDKANLSQLQAIQALLMWRQEDGRRHMEGARDENGKVTSKWSYDQAWVDEVEKALTPEARRVMGWITSKYGAEYATLNPLYRLRYGVNLPQHDAYAPITVTPMQTKAGEVVDPVTGAAVSGSGSILTPDSLRKRSRSAIAEPDFRDALQTFLGRSRQLEYWKAYYDLAVEANAILGNRDVMNAVHAKGGKEAASVLRQWIDAIAQGGFRDNSTRLELMRGVGRVVGRASGVALLGRISAVLVQSTQLAAASVQMPATAYLSRFARLFTGGLNWGEAINSPFIQRRFKTAPPIVRQAMEGLATAKPNAVMGATRALGNLLSGADALFTSGTYAILLDFHRAQGSAAGLTGAELEAYAANEAERGTEQVAQPTRMAGRSLAELTSTHPLAKASWAFASEARQKVALTGWALMQAKKDPARFAKAVVLTFLVGGLLSQVLKNALRELKGDDDKNLWSPQRLLYASTIAPLVSAVPLGSVALGDSNTLSSIQRTANSLDDGEIDMRDVDTILSAAGLFNDTAAGLAQLSHLGLDAAKVVQSLSE